eukprot:961387-Prorocentrum_minimum.AAC.2
MEMKDEFHGELEVGQHQWEKQRAQVVMERDRHAAALEIAENELLKLDNLQAQVCKIHPLLQVEIMATLTIPSRKHNVVDHFTTYSCSVTVVSGPPIVLTVLLYYAWLHCRCFLATERI